MGKHLVIETSFVGLPQKFHYLLLPEVRDPGFYREVSSFNAFFNSRRNQRSNVTECRQFTQDDEFGIEIRKTQFTDVDFDNLTTFANIHEFFKHIGYDPRSRSYRSGEQMKVWDGTRFVLPKKRKTK